MFKFMKSKKGFTLVELMIVVVIMAILVAVAVPIFSAVTENARKKTCLGNQRNIVSQINNQVMSGGAALKVAKDASQTITINTNDKGDKLASGTGDAAGIIDAGVFDTTGDIFKGMFSADNMPFCPTANGKVVVTVTNKGDNSCTISVDCQTYESTNAKDHVAGK